MTYSSLRGYHSYRQTDYDPIPRVEDAYRNGTGFSMPPPPYVYRNLPTTSSRNIRTETGHPGRGRSQSPAREDKVQQERNYRDRSSTRAVSRRSNVFADPYLEADRDRGRRPTNGNAAFQTEEYSLRNNGVSESTPAHTLAVFVKDMGAVKLCPKDIDGDRFRRLAKPQLELLGRTLNIFGSHIFGRLYEEHYKQHGVSDSLNQIMRWAQPGMVFTAPILQPLYDERVGVQTLDRINGRHGPGIIESRTNLIIKMNGSEA